MIHKEFKATLGARLVVKQHPEFNSDGVVELSIETDYGWTPECIQELRKFLKKLQKQLEAAD